MENISIRNTSDLSQIVGWQIKDVVAGGQIGQPTIELRLEQIAADNDYIISMTALSQPGMVGHLLSMTTILKVESSPIPKDTPIRGYRPGG